MRLARASLARRGTEAIPDCIRDEVPLGATYVVDLDSVRDMTWKDQRTGMAVPCRAIRVRDDATGSFGFFQLALLDIDEGPFEFTAAEKASPDVHAS